MSSSVLLFPSPCQYLDQSNYFLYPPFLCFKTKKYFNTLIFKFLDICTLNLNPKFKIFGFQKKDIFQCLPILSQHTLLPVSFFFLLPLNQSKKKTT